MTPPSPTAQPSVAETILTERNEAVLTCGVDVGEGVGVNNTVGAAVKVAASVGVGEPVMPQVALPSGQHSQ